MRSSFPSLHRRLLGLGGRLALALLLSALAPVASLGGVARAQEPPLGPKSPGAVFVLGDPAPAIAAHPDRDLQLELGADLRRAKRTARAGGFLLGIGAAWGIAGAVAWATLPPCQEFLCDFDDGMWAATGMVIGPAIAGVGLVTLSIGIARRNRLEALEPSLSIGAGPGTLDLRVSF